MRASILHAVTVWVVLVAATLVSYASWLDRGLGRHAEGVAVLAMAGFKALLMGMRYMELDSAPWPLRLVFAAWVFGVVAMLAAWLP